MSDSEIILADLPAMGLDWIRVVRANDGELVVEVGSGGLMGRAPGGNRLEDVLSLLGRRVAPFFLGRDVRAIESLVDRVYEWQSNYKFAGMPFWYGVAVVEMAVLDLLAGAMGRRVCDLLGPVVRTEVHHYVSRFARDTTAEVEVEQMRRALDESGCRAVKFKVGGRMSDSPHQRRRDLELIDRAASELGGSTTIFVDANGSFEADSAIRLGPALEAAGIAMFEEPCPWEDYESTLRVADALGIAVSGGEQDSSMSRWRWMVDRRAVDVVQPDVYYNGGLIRSVRVARMAAERGLSLMPHNPRLGFAAVPMLHLLAVCPNAGAFHESLPGGSAVSRLGEGTGWGYDMEGLDRATVVWESR